MAVADDPRDANAGDDRRQRLIAIAVTVLILGLLAYRAYAPQFAARPLAAMAGPKSIDVNRATKSELQQLPGVGPMLADAIVAERENKPFKTVEELHRVRGIGPETVDLLRSHAVVSKSDGASDPASIVEKKVVSVGKIQPGELKVDINVASIQELQRLPRIGPVLAAAIVDARAAKPFSTIEELNRVRGIGTKTLDGLRPFVVVQPAESPK